MMPAEITSITRDFLVHRIRTFDRAAIVAQAIIKAVENGYEFDAPIPLKKRAMEKQRKFQLAYDGERPFTQYADLVDKEQTKRLMEKLRV